MGVLTYINPVYGTVGATTYTTVSPELPNGEVWTTTDTVVAVVAPESPWNGATLLDLNDANPQGVLKTDLTSADVTATQGRMLIELEPWTTEFTNMVYMAASAPGNFSLGVKMTDAATDYLEVGLNFNNWNSVAIVAFASFPTNPFALEFIWDTNNGTANQRLRARWWDIGSTPGAFTDATTSNGSGATTDQPVSIRISDPSSSVLLTRMRRLVISDDITQDLSDYGLSSPAALMGGMSL